MATENKQSEDPLVGVLENGSIDDSAQENKNIVESNQTEDNKELKDNLIKFRSKYSTTREEIDALKSQGLVNLIGRGDNATAKIVAKSMEDLLWRLHEEQQKEKVAVSLLNDARDRHMEIRRQLHKKVQLKYAKEQDQERLDWVLRQKLMRIDELEKFIEEVRVMEEKGSPFTKRIEEVEKKLDEAYDLGTKRRNALIKACRRQDHLDMLITRAEEHEHKLKATAAELKRKIEHAHERRRRIKENALRSIKNAKSYFEKCVDVEADNKRLSERLRKVEIQVFDLEEKVNSREDSLRDLQMELKFRKLDLERSQTELLIKKQKKDRGMNTKQKAY